MAHDRSVGVCDGGDVGGVEGSGGRAGEEDVCGIVVANGRTWTGLAAEVERLEVRLAFDMRQQGLWCIQVAEFVAAVQAPPR